MSKKQTGRYEPSYDKDNIKKLPCQKCGKLVKRRIDPEFRRPIKVYCHACRHYLNLHPRIETSDSDAPILYIVKRVMLESAAGPVKVYKPGDEGFEERAEQFEQNRKEQAKGGYYWRTFGRT